MKLFPVFILLGFCCANCTDESKKDVDLIEAGAVMTSTVADTCNCDDLATNPEGALTKGNIPFTGVCILNYPATEKKYMVKNVLEGQLHGKVIYYDQTGNELMSEVYHNGERKRSGESAPISCDCSELTADKTVSGSQKIMLLDNIPFTGTCTTLFPQTGKKSMEATYKKGILHGFTTFYSPTGKTLYMEKYEKGEMVKVIYEEEKSF